MLAFTRKTDYALIALTHMAKHSEECDSAREIAGLYGIPLPLLMNILKQMAQQGLAQSVRGPRGGYRLAMPAEKISLNDIIKAVEGPVQLVQCVDWYQNKLRGKTKTGCDLMAACPVRPTIHLVDGNTELEVDESPWWKEYMRVHGRELARDWPQE